MDKVSVITICSALISLVTLGFTALNLRLGAKKDEISNLEKKMEALTHDIHDCERQCKELAEENLMLLRKLTNSPKDDRP